MPDVVRANHPTITRLPAARELQQPPVLVAHAITHAITDDITDDMTEAITDDACPQLKGRA